MALPTTSSLDTHRFFPAKETDIKALLPFLGRRMTSPEGLLLEGRQILYRAIIGEMREWLRAIWDAEDDYTREWRLSTCNSTCIGSRI